LKYQIAWIKWNEQKTEPDWEEPDETYFDTEKDEYKDNEPNMISAIPFPMQQSQPKPVVTEDDFNFWMGHTNFVITHSILDLLLNECPGVETVDLITSYRFRISIGLLFKSNEVMSMITQSVIGLLEINDKQETQP
jgi:hypothetical protein